MKRSITTQTENKTMNTTQPVSENTIRIYNEPNGVSSNDILLRGTGSFSRTANCPAYCDKIARGDQAPIYATKSQIKAIDKFFAENPRRKFVLICDKKAVAKWMKDHPKSKKHSIFNA